MKTKEILFDWLYVPLCLYEWYVVNSRYLCGTLFPLQWNASGSQNMKGDPGGSGKAAQLAFIRFSAKASNESHWSASEAYQVSCLCRFLDTSKQAIGMLFIHFANVYLSDLTEEDPCSLWVNPVFGCSPQASWFCMSQIHFQETLLKRKQARTAVLHYMHCSVSPRYLINFLLDASLGMLIIYAGVRAVSAIVEWRQWDSLRFGEYGEDCVCEW